MCPGAFKTSLPVDLGAHHEKVRMYPVEIGPVEGRRILEHIDPVRHEADSLVGIPVEAERKIRLPAALDVRTGAERLQEQKASAVEIDFAHSRREFPSAPTGRAPGVQDLDLAEGPGRTVLLGIWLIGGRA